MKKNMEDFNIRIGDLKRGRLNNIADVAGVRVGHVSYKDGDIRTGVTALIPHEGNIFREKLVAASHVINGFGKSIGTVQIDEMGSLETPIILTNTLSVGRAADGLIKYMLRDNPDIGRETSTINPVVCECNDGYLNDIQKMLIDEEDVYRALDQASENFEEGDVGAGTGMVSYGLKGGIGSSSRIIELGRETYTIGVLSLTNFGRMEDLRIDGVRIGREIAERWQGEKREDKGSVILILATDLPLSHRQLNRLIKKTYPGIASTGSFTSTGSGELVIGFSTANRIDHYEEATEVKFKLINENKINQAFKGAKEAAEEAILSSLINSRGVIGRDGHRINSLMDYRDLVEDIGKN